MARLLRITALCLLCAVLGLAAPAQAEVLTIGGTGSSGPLVQLLFAAFQKQAPDVTLRLAHPPLGSNGALKGLAAGRIDLAVMGRPMQAGETAPFGQRFDLADTPFVMASKDGQRRSGFTLEELARVYDGSLAKWDSGAPIRLVLRGSYDSDTLLLRTMSPALDRAVPLANTRPGMADAANDLDTVAVLAKTAGSLGPTTLGLLTTLGVNLVVHPLNGVAPSMANLKSGKYPWRKSLFVVLPRNPSPAATAFAAFLRSATAQAIMRQNDYLPAAQ